MKNKQPKLEKFITNLKAEQNYKNIKKGFEWNNIPKFAVITGENASGKTALLEQISFLSSENENEQNIFNNQINSQIKYFDNIKLEMEGDCSAVDEKMETFKENYKDAIKNGQNGKKDFYEEYCKYFKINKMPQKKFLKIGKDEFYKWLNSINDINIESEPMIFN